MIDHDIFDFDLTADEMKQINDIDMGEDGRFPKFFTFRRVTEHPEYIYASLSVKKLSIEVVDPKRAKVYFHEWKEQKQANFNDDARFADLIKLY